VSVDTALLAQLADALRSALAKLPVGGRLVPDAAFAMPEVAEQWLGCSNAPRFEVIAPVLNAAQVDGAVSLSGRLLLCDARGQQPEVALAARLHFFTCADDGETSLQLLVDFDPPTALDLARSWHTGSDTLWSALTVATTAVQFISRALPKPADDTNATVSLPASLWPTEGASPGLSFSGSITPAGPIWQAVEPVLFNTGPALSVAGNVAFDPLDGSTALTIRHAFEAVGSIALPGLGGATLTLDDVVLATGLGPQAWLPMSISAGASLRIGDETVHGSVELPVSAGPCRLECAAEPPIDLNHMLTAAGLTDVVGQLPGAADLGGLGVVGLLIEFEPATLTLNWIELRLATDRSWTLIPDILSLSPEFAVGKDLSSTDSKTYAHFAALWRLGASGDDGGILIETAGDTGTGELSAQLAAGERFDTSAFFNAMLPGVGIPAIELIDFELAGNYRTGSYTLSAEAMSAWTVDILGAQLGITDIEISASHDGSGFAGRLEALVALDGYVADISAELQGEQWEIDLQLPIAPVGSLLDHLLHGVTLPDDIRDFELRNVSASFVDKKSFALSATSNSEIDLLAGFGFRVAAFSVERTQGDGVATPTVDAAWQLALDLGGHAVLFDGTYRSADGANVWHFDASAPGTALPLGELLQKLTGLIGIELPLVVDHLQITDLDASVTLGDRRSFSFSCAVGDAGDTATIPYGHIAFAVSQRADGGWDHVIVADIDIGLGPEILPVVGSYLATPRFAVTRAALVLCSDTLSPEDRAAMFAAIKQTASSAALTIMIAVGDENIPVVVPFGPPVAAALPAAGASPSPAAAALSPAASAPPTMVATPSDQTQWLDINRAFGPVTLHRVGVRYRDRRLALVIDADMTLGPFSVDLIGLGVSSSLSRFDPAATLDGLGFGYNAGDISVSGGLMRIQRGDGSGYAGELSLSMPTASISLLGEYIPDPQSLFVYGIMDDPPLGGPAYFFVEGVAIGIGCNSHLTLPSEAGKVADFSLVKAAFPPAMSKDGLLAAMGQDFSARPGSGWFAVGLRFNSFKLIDSFALASVQIGGEVELSLLGLSRASLPPRADDPIALFEVGLLATFSPARGVLKVDAALTSKSFVLSRDAQLTGGYAFYAWLMDGSENGASYSAGDFVYSMGGFHPHFQVPAHYPRPARLQLSWQVSSELSVKGSCYFALTPQALMAGMGIEALFSLGDLSAWFDADADFLLQWKPFHYEGHIDCSIGVSYRVNLYFTSFRVTVHVGVGLDLHGPPFGGEANIDLSVVSFTISFGASNPERKFIDWTEFRTSFLHAGEASPATGTTPGGGIQPLAGLVRDQSKTATADQPRWVMRAEDAAFAVRFAAPAQTIAFEPKAKAATSLAGAQWTQALAIGPMGLLGSLKQNDALVHLEFLREADKGEADSWETCETMTFAPQLGNVPRSLWNPVNSPLPADPPLAGGGTIANALCGFAITPLPPVYVTTFEVDLAALRYEFATPVQSLRYGAATAPAAPEVSGVADGATLIIRVGADSTACQDYVLPVPQAADDAVQQRRAAIVAALGRQGMLRPTPTGGAVDLGRLAATTRLDDWPQVCVLGEELTR
jgi:hypothetical protein